MDAEGYKKEPHGTDPEIFWHVRPKSGNVDERTRDFENWRLVEVFLSGGAPWGFTLRGGLEHREPLLITKVEEGSKAAAVSLQVGDELVNINEIPLSGYRQEAICLVKGSHKTLSLVVKRQNETISRPHSWHSTKFHENQPETAKRQSPPMTVWNKRYDASSSSTDLSTSWEQTNLCRVSDQFSSLGSMDSLEHVSHPYPAGPLSPAKSTNSTEHLGGGKRDSAYSSFSTSSGTPDYSLSKSNAASTENMLHKVSLWDAAAKHNNCRHSQNFPSDGVKQDDRVTYFQIPGVSSICEGPLIEDPVGNRHSASSRTSFGPVWNVPEKKKTNSSSPPPPPPARSDSFATTKVHEKGMVVVHYEGSDNQASFQAPVEHVPSHNDSDHFKSSFVKSFHHQFASNKQYSLSSTDVRQGQPPQVSQSQYQKHLSDKSSVCHDAWATSMPKPHNVGGHFCSLQELPTNGSVQQFNQNQRRNLSSSLSPTRTDQTRESNLQSRYYCVATCQTTQPNQLSLSGIREDTRSTTVSESPQNINEQTSLGPPTAIKVSYNVTQQQHPSHDKHNNGYSKHQVATVLETPLLKPNSDRRSTQNAQDLYMSYPFSRQSEQRRSLPLQNRDIPIDSRPHSQVSNKICPQATPMLHSLSLDAADPDEKMKDTSLDESLDNKQVKHSERFATTLRNEIQMRRSRLLKSQSAAAVPDETEENQDIWKSNDCPTPSSSHGSFSNIYKDNLKEAQARVLKATSFRRRDLEPVLQDQATAEALPNHQASIQRRNKDVTPMPTVTELVTSHSGTSGGQFARVGGRKRFLLEKEMKSFSEPDKIHEVGMKENLALSDKDISLDQQKLFQESENLGFTCHMSLHKPAQDQGQDPVLTNARVDLVKGIRESENIQEAREAPDSACSPSTQDQQRLGTFAEYEARWNIQKKPPEERVSGRYRSADNILDHGPEERNKKACFHERSRSSPSADLYGQKIPVPARKSEPQYSQVERNPAEPLVSDTWLSDRGPGDCKVRENPGKFEYYPLQLPPMTGASPDCAHIGSPVNVSHKPTSNSHSLVESDDSSHPELPPALRKKPSMLEKPPQPRFPEVSYTHQRFASSQSEASIHCSAHADPSSSFGPTHSSQNSEQGKEPVDKEQVAAHHPSTSIPQPTSISLASSHRPMALASQEGQRSPSPQFSPQRLSDKPPLTLRNEDSKRMVHVIESQNTTVKKVPIRIVCSERSTDKDNCPFLLQNDSPAIAADHQGSAQLTSLGAADTDSVFCTFTRQRDPSNTSATQAQQPPQTNRYISTLMDPEPTAEHPNDNKVAVTAQLIKEDLKREELARDIVGKDKSLAEILDQSKMKTTMDLMDGIFPKGQELLEGAHPRKKVQMKQTSPRSAEEREKEDSMAAAVTMVTSSTYYSTSAPKAELLIKMKDMQDEEEEEENSEEELDMDLANKKQELINSLKKKLQVLQEARQSLAEDIQDNNALGDEVESHVQQVCKPNELDKFRMFVGDLDKVVSLLLSLSGRLARVENALNSLEEDATPEERRTLIEKRKLLIRQHDDAKELKENLDRRERVVYDILANYLPEDSLTDYEHFVKMKSALIIEQRKLEDKIKLGEEQLKCLVDSLPIEQQLTL